MSSGGHALDALNRIRQNRSMKARNRKKFKDNEREPLHFNNLSTEERKKISDEKVLEAKKQILEDLRRNRNLELKLYIIAVSAIAILLTIAYFKLKS